MGGVEFLRGGIVGVGYISDTVALRSCLTSCSTKSL